MSLVSLLNESQASESETSVFTGIQSCDPAVRGHLLQHPELRDPARDAAAAIRAEFPRCEIDVRMDVDPDDAQKAIVLRAKVPGLSVVGRVAFYDLAERIVSADLAGRIVLTVDRG